MIDIATTLFTTLLAVYVCIRAAKLDRLLPWFETRAMFEAARNRMAGRPAEPDGLRRPGQAVARWATPATDQRTDQRAGQWTGQRTARDAANGMAQGAGRGAGWGAEPRVPSGTWRGFEATRSDRYGADERAPDPRRR